MPRVLHGLIQKAKLDATNLNVKAYPGGKGFRVWRQTELGWTLIADMASTQDVEDFMVSQLTQEDR